MVIYMLKLNLYKILFTNNIKNSINKFQETLIRLSYLTNNFEKKIIILFYKSCSETPAIYLFILINKSLIFLIS